jgi:hypothetical protein
VRALVGAGMQMTELRFRNTSDQLWARGVGTVFVGDASVTLARDLGTRWAVTGGLLVSLIPSSTIELAELSVRQDLSTFAPVGLIGLSFRP